MCVIFASERFLSMKKSKYFNFFIDKNKNNSIMRRKITEELKKWKANPKRKPLILYGARQVGKTYILREFGASFYDNCVYINLETNILTNSFFEKDVNPSRILEFLEITANQRILPEKTLIILDEIQSSERALLSLKAFCEEAPQYHVIAAGSLLGVALHRERYSFPVGKVNEMQLYPFDFEEFLWALGKERLSNIIRRHFANDEKLPELFHSEALEWYKKYLIIGGMPAVVGSYAESGSLVDVRSIQYNILNEYVADMAKYANPATSVKIRACYNSIPAQLAKDNRKFQYKVVQRGGSASMFGESIEWLNFAGLVLKCQKTSQGTVPLAVNAELQDFKLYFGDVGLLCAKSGMPSSIVLSLENEDNTFIGALTENYVAQAFVANRIPLYYWTSGNTAEVDFLLQSGRGIVPVEVKAGLHTRSKSLGVFMERYKCGYAMRLSQKNFGFANNIKSVPLYAVFCIINSISAD